MGFLIVLILFIKPLGLYPVVGWVINDETVFIAEGNSMGTSAAMEVSKNIGLFEDVAFTSDMAYSVKDSGGVCFVPAFNGIQAPINDPRAVPLLLGECSQLLAVNLLNKRTDCLQDCLHVILYSILSSATFLMTARHATFMFNRPKPTIQACRKGRMESLVIMLQLVFEIRKC